jgi:uncharacterized protein with von Willebrand factor type A (vWA) domain
VNRFVELVTELRVRGLMPGPDRVAAAVTALLVLPDDPRRALRTTLCGSRADLDIFDAVWRPPDAATDELPAAHGGEAAPGGAAAGEGADAPGAGEGASGQTGLALRDVRELTPAELAELAGLIAHLAPAARRRRTARRVPAHTGRIDARRTARLMLRSGGEPHRILRTRRAWRPRRLVLLIDVSGSMRSYTDVLLRFAHAAVAAGPGVTEVFTLGTRWTRLTDRMRDRDADGAMVLVNALRSDWDRGTRLGPAVREFLRRWGGRTAVRSAVIVLISDGQEAGDKRVLPVQVARLSRLGHRLIWVNPARGRPGYVPVNPALTGSLPHADAHVPGHTLDALRRLAEVISR